MVTSKRSPSPPVSTLAIAARAGHAFTPQAMLKGFACHAHGVDLAATSPARVHARVRSKRLHDVLLRAVDGRLTIACTCPARSLGVELCEHAWAALLEVDRTDGALADLRVTRGPLVVEAAPVVTAPPRGDRAADAPADRPAPEKARARGSKEAGPKAEAAAVTRDARRTSPRSPRATAAPPAKRGTRRRSPR
jgi:hypothetical protein